MREVSALIIDLPLRQSAELIGPGQFAVGHLPRTPDVVEPLATFRKIFIHRDLRDALVSYQQRFVDAKRTGGVADGGSTSRRSGADARLPGRARPVVLPSDRRLLARRSRSLFGQFETLYGDHGEERQGTPSKSCAITLSSRASARSAELIPRYARQSDENEIGRAFETRAVLERCRRGEIPRVQRPRAQRPTRP